MKQLFTIIILILPIFAKSQSYFPFIDEKSRWHVLFEDYNGYPPYPHIQTWYYQFSGDTTINSMKYEKLWSTGIIPNASKGIAGFFREDILKKKVYFLLHGKEKLAFDFSLEMGDSTFVSTVNDDSIKIVVKSIDSVKLGDTFRKRFNVDSYRFMSSKWIGPSTRTIVEGFTLIGVLIQWIDVTSDSGSAVTCYFYDNKLIYLDPHYKACDYKQGATTSIDEPTLSEPKIYVSSGYIHIELCPDFGLDNHISIYNVYGQKCKTSDNVGNTYDISTAGLNTGLYFVQVFNQKNRFTQKVWVK